MTFQKDNWAVKSQGGGGGGSPRICARIRIHLGEIAEPIALNGCTSGLYHQKTTQNPLMKKRPKARVSLPIELVLWGKIFAHCRWQWYHICNSSWDGCITKSFSKENIHQKIPTISRFPEILYRYWSWTFGSFFTTWQENLYFRLKKRPPFLFSKWCFPLFSFTHNYSTSNACLFDFVFVHI